MDDTNPLYELPPEVLAEMTPDERLVYLALAGEDPPPEVTTRARTLGSDLTGNTEIVNP